LQSYIFILVVRLRTLSFHS